MPTKYDVFAELVEKAPCIAKDLPFKTPVYAHLNSLIREKLVKKEHTKYTPLKNNRSTAVFSIIKYCLKNGLNYNLFLSKNIPKIVQELFCNAPGLRPKSLSGNKENVEILKYLEKNQFMLITKKKPRKGIILKHQLFESIKKLYNIRQNLNTAPYFDILHIVKAIKGQEINPFDDKVFEFLSGSAQLEGSTITAGETRELIINDIYPDKPKKDIQMVKNLNEAMHYLLEHKDDDITENHIKEINKIILFSMHRNAGKYKISHNRIQGNPDFRTAHPQKVPAEMKKYCEKLKTINTKEKCLKEIGFIHNELQHIHPFSDGNSRTTRTILNWMLLKCKSPFLVLRMGCFNEYMGLTKLSSTRKDEKLAQLFQHIMLHEELMS